MEERPTTKRPRATSSSWNPDGLTDNQISDLLRPLGAHRPWTQILGSAGFVESGPDRWLSPEGRIGELVADDTDGVALVMTQPDDDQAFGDPMSCRAAFIRFHHEGRWKAAAGDLVRAASGDAHASQAALALPKTLLSEIAAIAGVQRRSPATDSSRAGRSLRLTAAADITMLPQRWLWKDLIPLGALTLLAGREQVGKSTCAFAIAAEVTKGGLPGELEDRPRNVVVVASEDSWASTITPRLTAARADLTRVFRLEVNSDSEDDMDSVVSLPDDLHDLEELIQANEISLIILDPLLSRLGAKLDTHRDGDVRRGLEPLVAVAQRTDSAVLGLIHVNKTVTFDALTSVMASRAFTAVARAVLFAAMEPDGELRYLQLVKSNLGSTQIPTMTFSIEGTEVASATGEPITTSKLLWGADTDITIHDLLKNQQSFSATRTTRISDASAWLKTYLLERDGAAALPEIRMAAADRDFGESLLQRARQGLNLKSESQGTFPNTTMWTLPEPKQQ